MNEDTYGASQPCIVVLSLWMCTLSGKIADLITYTEAHVSTKNCNFVLFTLKQMLIAFFLIYQLKCCAKINL